MRRLVSFEDLPEVIPSGIKVIKGPDWDIKLNTGGKVGTIDRWYKSEKSIDPDDGQYWVKVIWENQTYQFYAVGPSIYHLCYLDDPIENTIELIEELEKKLTDGNGRN